MVVVAVALLLHGHATAPLPAPRPPTATSASSCLLVVVVLPLVATPGARALRPPRRPHSYCTPCGCCGERHAQPPPPTTTNSSSCPCSCSSATSARQPPLAAAAPPHPRYQHARDIPVNRSCRFADNIVELGVKKLSWLPCAHRGRRTPAARRVAPVAAARPPRRPPAPHIRQLPLAAGPASPPPRSLRALAPPVNCSCRRPPVVLLVGGRGPY